MGLFLLGSAFTVLLGVSASCNSAPKGPINVPLTFRPAHAEPISTSLAASDMKVHVEQVKDKRPDKDTIGQNTEDANALPVYAADKQPGEFLRSVLIEELQKNGVEMADAPEAADRIISIDLTRFYCEESNTYRAEVAAVADVRNKGGKSLWKGTIGGKGETFGRSRSPENYNEAFSDATRRTVGTLLNNPKFAEAIAK
jgi:hypothetical protein